MLSNKVLVDEFKASDKKSFTLHTGLDTVDRQGIHEYAEGLGLLHSSAGTGNKRAVVLR